MSLNRLFHVPGAEKTTGLICGILDFFLFGVGTIILGVLKEDVWVIVAGILQLCLPFVGWLWSIIWGVLIIKKAGWF